MNELTEPSQAPDDGSAGGNGRYPDGRAFATGDMKADWDARAKACAKEYVLTGYGDKPDEAFWRSADGLWEAWKGYMGPDSVVVDLGAGIGRVSLEIAPRVKRLYAVDVSAEMLRQARERLDGLDNVVFYENDGYSLERIPTRSVDFVYSMLVLHHAPESALRANLREVARVLKPGGRFWFTIGWRKEGEPKRSINERDTFEGRAYTRSELRRALGRGMKIVAVSPPQGPSSFFREVLARRRRYGLL